MLSVIVIGKNEAQNLAACFESVQSACHPLPHEIIYVDSNSTDNSLEIAGRYAKTIKVLDPAPNPGLGRAIGTSVASGDWLLFLDGDMQLKAGFVEKAIAFADARKSDAVTGLRHDIYYHDGKVIHENINYFMCKEIREAPEFGGALLIRRESLLRCGGWSTSTIACEEEELHSRLTAHDMHVLEIPFPMIIHTDHVTENRSSLQVLFSKRRLGEGEAFRCTSKKGNMSGYIRGHRTTFIFYVLDLLSLLSILFIHPLGLPVFCALQFFQLGFYISRKLPRRFITQKLFFFYFPVGCLTYHERSLEYEVISDAPEMK